jgi:hypothetical protein
MSPLLTSKPSPGAIKAISAVVGVLALAVLVQAFTAGRFVGEPGKSYKGFVDAHKGVGDLVVLLAVVAVAVAFTMWRGKAGFQMVAGETVVLLVLTIIQFGVGQQVSKHPGLLTIHIPVAVLIFGVTTHLSTYVANLRRSAL